MRHPCFLLLLCILFSGGSGCAGIHGERSVLEQPVFSNGSVVTGEAWISMDPAGDHSWDRTLAFSGQTNLPAGETIEVIVVRSGPSAAEIRILDDCVTTRQKCALFYGIIPDTGTIVSRWSITPDSSMDIFRNESPGRYIAIVRHTGGVISARSEFGLS